MYEADKESLARLMNLYSVKEIIQGLSDLALIKASMMSDLELSDASKKWSEAAFILQSTAEVLNS